jgi:hypothetical protein
MLLVMLLTKQLLNIKPLQTDQRAPHTASTGAAPITTTGTIQRGRAHLTSQMRLRLPLGELQRGVQVAAVVADAAGAAARLLRHGEQRVLARLLGGGAWTLGAVFAQVGQLF